MKAVKPEDPIIDDGNDGSVDGTPGTKPDEDSDFVESIPDGSYDDDMNVWIPEHPIDPDPELPIEEEPNHPIDPSPSIPGTDGDEAIGDGGVEGTDPTTPDNDSDLIEGEMPDKPVTPEDPIIDDGGDGSVDGTPGTKPDGDSDFVESIPDGSYDDDMNLIIPEHPIEEKPELPIQPEPDFGDDLVDGGGVDGTPSTPDEDTDLIEGVMPDKPVKPEDPIIDDGGDGSVDGTPGTKPDEDSDFVESIPDGSYDDDMNIVLPQHPIEPPKPDDSEDMIDGDQGGPNGCSGPGCYYPGKPSPDEDESDLIEGEMPDKPVKPEDPIIDDGEDGSVDGKPGTKPDEDSDFVESIPDGSYDDDMNIWIPEHPIEPEPELPIQPEPDYGDKPIIDDGEDGSVDGKPGTKPDDDSDFVDGLEFDVNVSVRTLKLKPYTKVGKHTPLSSSVVETMGISYGGHVELPTVEYSFVNDDGVSFSRPECLEDRNPRINRITEVSDKYYVMSLSHPGSAKDCSWGEHDKTSDYIVHKDEGYALELPFSVDMYGKEYAHLKPHSAHNTTDRVILLAYPENGNEHQLAYIVRPELNIIKPTMRIDRPIEGASNWAIFRPESIQDPDKPLPSVFYFYYTVEPDTVDSRGKVRNGKLAKYYALEGSQQEPVLKLKWREAHDIGYPFLVEGNMYAPDETPNQGNGYHYYKLIEGKHGGSWTEKDNLFPETMPRLANVTDVITHGDTSYVVTEFCTMYDENGKLYSKTSIFDHHLTNKKKQNTILVKDDSVFCYGDALSVKDKGYVPAIASIDVVNGAVDAERFKFVKDINTNGSDVVNARLNRTHLVFDLDNVPHSMDMKEMQTVNQEQYYGEEGLISDIIYLE
ncbi:hypothetical protein KI655_18635 [Vibrio sp. D404a]|uniref:hypothetical protein n=1 Tax=Vibrio sp. D404a TaxID=2836434 RepID=UPI002555DAEA|nr:hypothetical protein [Vibrio sp. D404a]MDK9739316.1 hypothetical protein [Vibrio sp. D404a]